MFPNMALLLSLVITLPVMNAGCERAFSMQNRLKTKLPGGKAGHPHDVVIVRGGCYCVQQGVFFS